MHHFYQRGKKGTWWVQIRHDKERHQFSCKTTNKKEAQKYANEEYRKLLAGNRFIERTFGEALERYQKSAPVSMWKKAQQLHIHTPQMLDLPLHLVPAAAHDMRDAMYEEGYSPCTINRLLAVCIRINNLAFQEWNWLEHPLKKIKKLDESGTEREIYLTHEEVQALALGLEEPFRTILLISAYTGLRRNNVINMERRNLHRPELRFTAKDMKSKKPHSVPLPEFLWDQLEALMHKPDVVKMDGTDRVWGVNDDALEYAWRHTRQAAGLLHVQYRDLRHTFASWLAADPTVPFALIRDLMNHSSIVVTNKYAHLRSEEKQAASDKLAAQLEKMTTNLTTN